MSDLIAISYKEEDSALGALNELVRLQKERVIELEDAAVATMNAKGKVKVKQTLERQYTGTMATWGFFWGFLIGMIFGGPIFWGLATALLSGVLGKTADLGIDNKFIKEVGDSLEPGQSLEKFGGEVRQTSLSKEDEEKLRKALEHEHVSKGAEEMLEVDDSPAA
jgi:uncharacterized membrane protein